MRFDPVYVTHFRCDRRRIVDYPALSGYLRDLYAVPGVAGTVDFDQIRRHYFLTHPDLNPRGSSRSARTSTSRPTRREHCHDPDRLHGMHPYVTAASRRSRAAEPIVNPRDVASRA